MSWESYKYIIDDVINSLFNPDLDRMRRQMVEINRSNNLHHQVNHSGFLFRGQWFNPDKSFPMPQRKERTKLALHLEASMETLEAEQKLIGDHKQLIKQAMAQMYMQCNNIQEVRDATPECLVPLTPHLKNLNRLMANWLWLWKSDPRTARQIEAVLPLMEQYSVASLLY